MKKIKKLQLSRLEIVLCIMVIFTAGLMLLTFNYWDGQTLMAWSVNNYDLLFEGRIRDFYVDKQLNLRGAIQRDGCSSPLMLIPQMIWNFPIWITHRSADNLNVGTVGCVYWYKLFLLGMTVWAAYIVYKILIHLTKDEKKSSLGFLLVMASPEIMLSTMYTGQDEIVYIVFMLLALYALLKGNRKGFLAWSTCSITCCPIMLIPFLIYVCIYEKRIWKILVNCIITMIPSLVWALISIGAEAKDEVAISSSGFMGKMLGFVNFPITTGNASVAGILLFICIIAAYFAAEEEKNYVWYGAASMVIIAFFMDNFFYRLMLYVPYVIILILSNSLKKNGTFHLFLFTILAYLRMFVGGYESPQNLNTSYVVQSSWMVNLCKMTGSEKYMLYDDLNSKLIEKLPALADFVTIMNAGTLVCIGMIMWLTYPKQTKEFEMKVSENGVKVAYAASMPIIMLIFYALLLK